MKHIRDVIWQVNYWKNYEVAVWLLELKNVFKPFYFIFNIELNKLKYL